MSFASNKSARFPGQTNPQAPAIPGVESAAPLSSPQPQARPDGNADLDALMREKLIETADALSVDHNELAAMISYETGGTMDPRQPGPTTKWGQHRGLIQFGEPQAKAAGVDFSTPQTAIETQLGADGAIVNYALRHGFVPGEHSALDLYSTINAGSPGLYNAVDGTSTVAEKYNLEMESHRRAVADGYGISYGSGSTGGTPTGGTDAMGPTRAESGEGGIPEMSGSEAAAARVKLFKSLTDEYARDDSYALDIADDPVVASPRALESWAAPASQGVPGVPDYSDMDDDFGGIPE